MESKRGIVSSSVTIKKAPSNKDVKISRFWQMVEFNYNNIIFNILIKVT